MSIVKVLGREVEGYDFKVESRGTTKHFDTYEEACKYMRQCRGTLTYYVREIEK